MEPAPRPSIPGTHCAPGPDGTHYRRESTATTCRIIARSTRFLRQCGSRTQPPDDQHLEPRRSRLPDADRPAAIKRELLGSEVLQVDETPIRYLNPGHGRCSRGYLWVYLDPQSGTVYYDWQLGRGHDCLLDFLGYDEATNTILYSGTLQCDGYSAYQALAKRFAEILLAGCLAHIRRKFIEARDQAPEVVLPMLAIMQQLYRIEEELRESDDVTSDHRLSVRRAQSRPLVDELKRMIDAEREAHLPKSKLGEAVTYALGQWDEFERYLDDGRIEIDNNLCENAVRPTKLGEKNHLFFGSAGAGGRNALLYTLVRNCSAHGIDPEVYLAEAIRRMPEDPSDDDAAALTPAKLAPHLRPAVAEAA